MPDGAPQNDENSEAGAIEAALRRFAFVYTVEIGPVRPGVLAYERELAGRLALTALVVHRMHGPLTATGVRRVVVVPSPSCPEPLAPQHRTTPLPFRPQP